MAKASPRWSKLPFTYSSLQHDLRMVDREDSIVDVPVTPTMRETIIQATHMAATSAVGFQLTTSSLIRALVGILGDFKRPINVLGPNGPYWDASATLVSRAMAETGRQPKLK
jgi:hypothetical protein